MSKNGLLTLGKFWNKMSYTARDVIKTLAGRQTDLLLHVGLLCIQRLRMCTVPAL